MILVIGTVMIFTTILVGRKSFSSRKKRKASHRKKLTRNGSSSKPKSVNQSIKLKSSQRRSEMVTFSIAKATRRQQQYVLRLIEQAKLRTQENINTQAKLEIKDLIANANAEQLEVKYNRTLLEQDKIEVIKREVDAAASSKLNEIKTSSLDLRFQELDLTKREEDLKLMQKELKIKHQEKSLNLKNLMHEIKVLQDEVNIAEKRNQIFRVETLLKIKEDRLNSYSEYIDQMNLLRHDKIRIAERENKVNYRERKVELNNLYQRTLVSIDKLRYIPYKESEAMTHQRNEAYFKHFMNYHFKWMHMN